MCRSHTWVREWWSACGRVASLKVGWRGLPTGRVGKQSPRQVALGQHQPVVPPVIHQSAAVWADRRPLGKCGRAQPSGHRQRVSWGAALMPLAGDVRLGCLPLGVQGGELLRQALLRGFPRVDGTADDPARTQCFVCYSPVTQLAPPDSTRRIGIRSSGFPRSRRGFTGSAITPASGVSRNAGALAANVSNPR